MAPYAFGLVGFGFLMFFIHLGLRAAQRQRDFLWYRQWLTYKRLPLSRKRILQNYPFYKKLNATYQRQFEHRVAHFIQDKDFKHRYNEPLTDEQIVKVAAVACRLSFGRRNYLYQYLNTILFFSEPFQSPTNEQLHKGEYNPRAKVLAISWPDFKIGMDIENDNLHLGLHEFTHVMHIESEKSTDIDALRYHKYHQLILRRLMDPAVRAQVDSTQYFRSYAFTNQYEFMAVLTEYFFESPTAFKNNFPVLYDHLKIALLYKDEWIR